MRDQIFLSHAHEDKDIVDGIAKELRALYGQDKVFYDSWSMKPGESFIEGMDKGLSKCKFFFLFMSETSMKKPMVRLEWHNALVNSLYERSSFIPVRVDDIKPPNILISTLYIDMYNRGITQTIEDMKQLISGNGIYNPDLIKPFENLEVKYEKSGDQIILSVCAKKLVEHENCFAFSLPNDLEIFATGLSEAGKGSLTINNVQSEIRWIKSNQTITPNSPMKFHITNSTVPFKIDVMQVLGNKPKLIYSNVIVP